MNEQLTNEELNNWENRYTHTANVELNFRAAVEIRELREELDRVMSVKSIKCLLDHNARFREILNTILMKLEDYHKYAEPEKNAFIENMPIHIRATLKGD